MYFVNRQQLFSIISVNPILPVSKRGINLSVKIVFERNDDTVSRVSRDFDEFASATRSSHDWWRRPWIFRDGSLNQECVGLRYGVLVPFTTGCSSLVNDLTPAKLCKASLFLFLFLSLYLSIYIYIYILETFIWFSWRLLSLVNKSNYGNTSQVFVQF